MSSSLIVRVQDDNMTALETTVHFTADLCLSVEKLKKGKDNKEQCKCTEVSVHVGDVDFGIGPNYTFDESEQISSASEDDISSGLDVGRVEGRIGVQVQRMESEVVLIW